MQQNKAENMFGSVSLRGPGQCEVVRRGHRDALLRLLRREYCHVTVLHTCRNNTEHMKEHDLQDIQYQKGGYGQYLEQGIHYGLGHGQHWEQGIHYGLGHGQHWEQGIHYRLGHGQHWEQGIHYGLGHDQHWEQGII